MTDWAAKVLEGVPTTSIRRPGSDEDSITVIALADALAAIARMGAGDGLVERLLARKGRYGAFKLTVEDGVNVLRHEPVPDPLCQEAAAHIAALTAQVAELNRRAAVTRDARYNQGYADCLNSGGVADARAEALKEAAAVADAFADQSIVDAAIWRREGMPKTAVISEEHAKAARLVAAAILALINKENKP